MEGLAGRLGIAGHVHFVGHVDAEARDLLYGIADVAAFRAGTNLSASLPWKPWPRACPSSSAMWGA